MAARGKGRSQSIISKYIERGDAGLTPAGIALAKRGIEPLSQAITKFCQEAKSGKAGRKATAYLLLEGVDPDLAAFVTIRAALSGAAKRYTLKSTALTLAERLECELIADRFEVANEALFRAVLRNAASRGLAPERQANAMLLANQKFAVVQDLWTSSQRLHVGIKLIELLIESLGIVESYLVFNRRKRNRRLQLSPRIAEWFPRYNEGSTLTRPLFLPTVVPPKAWDSPFDGAYFSPVMGHAKIMGKPFPGQIEALSQADMGIVYGGLNALQETPWRINQRVLAVMKQAWEMDAKLTCLPERKDDPIGG
jgi:DNA-directed RNA polymerase, mitochondrial